MAPDTAKEAVGGGMAVRSCECGLFVPVGNAPYDHGFVVGLFQGGGGRRTHPTCQRTCLKRGCVLIPKRALRPTKGFL
jgi:hypothetical protein